MADDDVGVTRHRVQYICVLDFEATCWEGSLHKDQMEIIEFPSVLLRVCVADEDDSGGGGGGGGGGIVGPIEQVAEFAEYVRPTLVPQLTPFCTALTGIEQATVDAAREFAPVFRAHMAWLWEHTQGAPCVIATCGHWDLKTQLPRELRRPHHGLRMSQIPSVYAAYINVKDEFEGLYRCKGGGMTDMLAFLQLPLIGRHHSGIDDTRNIAAMLVRLLENGRRLGDMRVNRVPRDLFAGGGQQQQQQQQGRRRLAAAAVHTPPPQERSSTSSSNRSSSAGCSRQRAAQRRDFA